MKDKQIEEMAKITCLCNACGICECDKEPCDLDCSEGKAMERLYNAGYRKSQDVAEEIFAEIETLLNLSKCYGDSGIYFERDIETDIAKLKKKYESEKKNEI